jgi:DNA-binding beta-propeller fold protein YncE
VTSPRGRARTGLAAAIALACACSQEGVLEQAAPSREAAVFVVNSLGETLSRILLADGTVVRNALPLGSGPNAMALTAGGERGYVVSSLSNRIELVDLDELRVVGSIDIGPGSNPFALVLAGDHSAYVTNLLAGEVGRIHLDSQQVAQRLPVGPAPEGLLLVENAVYVAVTNFDYPSGPFGPGEVVVIRVAAGGMAAGGMAADRDSVIARLGVGTNPQALALAPDGTVHVICTGDYAGREGRVFVLEPTLPAVVDSIDIGGSPGSILVLEDGTGVTGGYYGGLRIYDRESRTVRTARALAHEEGLAALAFDSVEDLLYVADFDDSVVHVVDLAVDSVLTRYSVGHGPVHLAIRR